MFVTMLIALLLAAAAFFCGYFSPTLPKFEKEERPCTKMVIALGCFIITILFVLICAILQDLGIEKARHYTESDLIPGHVYCQRGENIRVAESAFLVFIDDGLEVQDYCLETPLPQTEYFIPTENGSFCSATQEDFENSIHPDRAIPLPWQCDNYKFGREVITETVEDFAPVRKEKNLNDMNQTLNDLDQVIKEVPSDGEGSK